MKQLLKIRLRWSLIAIFSALIIQSCELENEEPPDDDGDGIENSVDNCPNLPNPDQADANDDGIGDACEGDLDEDGILDYLDNCPETPNEDQADFDDDGIGDLCDETTVTEDRDHIQSALDITFNCIRNLKNGDGIDFIMEDMLMISGGESPENIWAAALVENLGGDLFEDLEEGDGIGIYLSEIGGVYEFNKADSSWSKSSSSTSRLELQFPTTESKSANNASLVLEDYSDEEHTIEEENYHLPTSGTISLSVDGTELLAVSINEVVYGTGDLPIPSKVDVAIYVNPMTLQIVLESESSTQYAADVNFSGDDGCSFGAAVEVKLAHDDLNNLVFEEDIESLTAEVRLEFMSIVTASNLAELFSLQDPTEDQINELVDLDLLINNFKVADVEYSEEDETIYLIFKDESKEDALDYFEDFFNDVIALIEDFTGELFTEEAS